MTILFYLHSTYRAAVVSVRYLLSMHRIRDIYENRKYVNAENLEMANLRF